MALQRTNQELTTGITERSSAELRAAKAQAADLQAERDGLKDDLRRLEDRVAELQGECSRAVAAADSARMQHLHYKVRSSTSFVFNKIFFFLQANYSYINYAIIQYLNSITSNSK